MKIKSRAELLRAIKLPGIQIKVVQHWQPQLQNTIRQPLQIRAGGKKGIQTNGYWFNGVDHRGKACEMWAEIPSAAELRFNDDGTITFHPDTPKSWTLTFDQPASAIAR